MIGEVLGNRYELIENIGEGGMAIVYKARDKKLNRLVAVKILKKEFSDNVEIAEKFKREATAIANLSDTNIVNVLDVGHEEDSNTEYFVMEYVNGKTLKELIVYSGKLAYTTAINIAIQIAKALECAHKNNIIHRDIKPQNILVTENGDVKVTDFGIAKSTTASTITNTTTIMGSAHYLSPEQAKGTFVDARTDLYSLGIVIYEMVTGRLPFDGESPVTIALKHIQEQPVPPKQITASIPDSLNALILKAISKEPINRYQSSREMMTDLQKIKDDPNVIIAAKANLDDSRTIIMSPITDEQMNSSKIGKTNENKVKNEEFVNDDDELDDDFDEDENGYDDDEAEERKPAKASRKNTNGGKRKKVIITTLIIVLLMAIAIPAGMMLLGGEKDVVLPDLAGKTEEQARAQLESLKIKLQVEKKVNSEQYPEGQIVATNPVANTTVKTNSTVYVTISAGVEKVVVPDVRDISGNAAKAKLSNLDLNYNVTEQYSDSVEAGNVISQSPEKNTEVEKGTTVELVISVGPETKYTYMPNLMTLGKDAAKNVLENSNLKLGNVKELETSNENEDGIVLGQSYDTGTQLEEWTTVDITIGKFVEPDIDVNKYLYRNMGLAEAIKALKDAGIEYTISGGNPAANEYELYKVTNFTETIKKGQKVKLQIQEIPSTPADNNSGSGDNGGSGSNSGGSSGNSSGSGSGSGSSTGTGDDDNNGDKDITDPQPTTED